MIIDETVEVQQSIEDIPRNNCFKIPRTTCYETGFLMKVYALQLPVSSTEFGKILEQLLSTISGKNYGKTATWTIFCFSPLAPLYNVETQ